MAAYPELWRPNDGLDRLKMKFPTECPVCNAVTFAPKKLRAAGLVDNGPLYECGGQYTFKPQIQNHTNKWWGRCDRR